jgi:predicted TPR repeat methyltransferase
MARTGVPVEPPERASASYVRREFDQFADRFDDVLVSKLGYRAPALVSEALAEARSNAGLRVLDAGCGTGLCAPLLRPHADRLVGVDLSSRMLEKARERGGYDALHEGDLSELPRSFDGAFDVVVAADVILYFGRLDGVLRAFRGVLDANGILIFTVEAAASERGWTLGEGGRFAHDERYVRAVLAEARFVVAALREEVLRYELGEEVRGLVVTAVTA